MHEGCLNWRELLRDQQSAPCLPSLVLYPEHDSDSKSELKSENLANNPGRPTSRTPYRERGRPFYQN